MLRVTRKEVPKTHSRIPRKLDQNSEILKPRQIAGVEQVLSFKLRQIQLSRSYRGAVEEIGAFSIDPPAIEQLSSYLSIGVERCRAVVELSVRKCRAICPALMNSFSSLVSWSNLHGFDTRLEQHIS